MWFKIINMKSELLKKRRTDEEYKALGRMMEDLYLANTSKARRLLWYNFVRGLAYGFGIFIAGTFVVGLIVWLLGLFDQVPLVGPFIQNIVDQIN
jgi:Domain of unknown function (DUF5665)